MGEALVSIIPGMERTVNEVFTEKADACRRPLLEREVRPKALVEVQADEKGNARPVSLGEPEKMKERLLKKGDSVCLDFGDHYVGYVTLKLNSAGSPQDAPAYLRLKFGEIAGKSWTIPRTMTDGSAKVGFRRSFFISMFFPVRWPFPEDTRFGSLRSTRWIPPRNSR